MNAQRQIPGLFARPHHGLGINPQQAAPQQGSSSQSNLGTGYADIDNALGYLNQLSQSPSISSIEAMLSELAIARAALANGGDANTYAAGLQKKLDECSKNTGGVLIPGGGAASDKTVTTGGAIALSAGSAVAGGVGGFFLGRWRKR